MLFSPKANRQVDKSCAEKLNDSVSCSLPPSPQAQGSFWRTTFKVYTALRCKLVLLKELLNFTLVAWPDPYLFHCHASIVTSFQVESLQKAPKEFLCSGFWVSMKRVELRTSSAPFRPSSSHSSSIINEMVLGRESKQNQRGFVRLWWLIWFF